MKLFLLFFFPMLTIPQPPNFFIWIGFLFLAGACLGSFLNVCVYRIPLGVSLVWPGSSCAACGRPIPPGHNIPLVSWLWLRGRAACCGTPIDGRYFWVELAGALLLPALFLRFPWPMGAAYAVLLGLLGAASLIDFDHFLIPDRISFGGIAAGLTASALCPALHGQQNAWLGFNEGLRGAFWGAVLLGLVVVLGAKVFKKEAMGWGDVKLLAAIGSFLGWRGVLFSIAVSALLGSLFGLILLARRRPVWGTRIPYGPFLSIAAFLWIFGGQLAYAVLGIWWRIGLQK